MKIKLFYNDGYKKINSFRDTPGPSSNFDARGRTIDSKIIYIKPLIIIGVDLVRLLTDICFDDAEHRPTYYEKLIFSGVLVISRSEL